MQGIGICNCAVYLFSYYAGNFTDSLLKTAFVFSSEVLITDCVNVL